MAYGFRVPTQGQLGTPENICTVARLGEELGFGYISVSDHLIIPREFDSYYPYSDTGKWPAGKSREAGSYLELLSLLAFLAGVTDKVRLLPAVMVLPYRPALLTAKALATVDVLSGGRLTVGVGVGWLREEFEAVGAPPFEDRGRASDEFIEAFKILWTEEDPVYDGEHVKFSNVIFLPKPVQKPHPPIWIGGESRPALRRTARLADGWVPIGNNPRRPLRTVEQYAAAMAEIHAFAEEAGRDPAEIHLGYMTGWRTVGEPEVLADGGRQVLTGAPEEIADDIGRFRELGVEDFICQFLSPTIEETLDHMSWFAEEVMPRAGG
jgi:probable F420-dependent oxidoreductase